MGVSDVKTDITDASKDGEPSSSTNIQLIDSPSDMKSTPTPTEESQPQYKVYKRRFFGLAQLVLLNIVVSWDWLTFSAVSNISADFFRVSEGTINWLSTAFLLSFVVATPATIWALNRSGPKLAKIITACLLLVGNWIRYGGTKAGDHGNFGVVMFGQLLIGLSQPFCLSAPTRYSDLWFTDRGRISATAVASLANPFGGALGQLIGPFLATKASDIPNMVLYISIISTVASVPTFFSPSHPPTPPSAASTSHSHENLDVAGTFKEVARSTAFWLIAVPFIVYVGLFNAISSLLNQILEPYGFSQTDAGITGALLIVVGLVCSAVVSPIVDKYKAYVLIIKLMVPIIGLCYLIFYWMPATGSITGSYVVCAILGASSFSLLPVALEFLVEIMYPLGPEVSSTLSWCGGQISGAVFIIIMNALKAGPEANPPANMKKALLFQAVIAMVTVPVPLFLGYWGIEVTKKRLDVDRHDVIVGIAGPRHGSVDETTTPV